MSTAPTTHGLGKPSDVAGIAARMRFDTAYRCASPVRLTYVPKGARLMRCSISLFGADLVEAGSKPTRLAESLLTVGTGPDDQLEFEILRSSPYTVPGASALTVAGQPAEQYADQLNRPSIRVADFDGVEVTVTSAGADTVTVLKQVMEAVKVTGDGVDPASWPDRLIG